MFLSLVAKGKNGLISRVTLKYNAVRALKGLGPRHGVSVGADG